MPEDLAERVEKADPEKFKRAALAIWREVEDDVERDRRFNVQQYLLDVLKRAEGYQDN